jgi:glycosyltransferase involved in cell wall biosynthesis
MDLINVPLVSIASITYNHESYIRQCIEGFLMQKTTFPIEIIIHDDASTDNTAVILQEYTLKYPDLIFPIFQKKNQFSQGINPGVKFVFPKCKGKYIAICEGDDYWTAPYKLQKQVDFLEGNVGYSICFHQVSVVTQNNIMRKYNNIEHDKTFNIYDLTKGNFIATSSCVFRNRFSPVPEWMCKIKAGDWGLHMFNAQFGYIYFMNDCMSTYRIHDKGAWSSLNHKEMILEGVRIMKFLDSAFNYKYHEHFEIGITNRLKRLETEKQGRIKQIVKKILLKIGLLNSFTLIIRRLRKIIS